MKLRTPVALAGAAALAVTTGLVTTANPSSAAATKSYAYGFSIGGQGQQPYAEYPKGPTSGGGELPPELGPLASGGVLTVSAGNNQARATVTNLTLGSGLEQLPQPLQDGLTQLGAQCAQLPATPENPIETILDGVPGGLKDVINTPESLQAVCLALGGGDFTELARIQTLDTECTGRTGTVEVSNARVFNSETPLNDSDVDPNTSLLPEELAPLIEVTLNRQRTNDQGGFVVEGLVLALGGQEVAVLASATCGERIPAQSGPSESGNPGGRAPTPPRAEAPKPVQQNVPVTG